MIVYFINSSQAENRYIQIINSSLATSQVRWLDEENTDVLKTVLNHFTWLVAIEEFFTLGCRESFRSYWV